MAETSVATESGDGASDGCTAFDCNICLCQAKDPVVTVCGHLYCWPCLFRWMETPSTTHNCPVCNAGLETSKVIPIYGRGCDHSDPREKEVIIPEELPIVPRRPQGQRPQSAQRPRGSRIYSLQNLNPLTAFLSGASQYSGHEAGQFSFPLTPDQQNRVFLQRLMMMIGSFIILFLVLY